MKLGVIAEDTSDWRVIEHLTRAMVPGRPAFTGFAAHGCGKLIRKCASWARDLVRRKCDVIVVIHDLDTNVEPRLRRVLETSVAGCGVERSIVLIPRVTIEAWLMCDAAAIAKVFRRKDELRLPVHPERELRPKDKLERLIRATYGEQYLSTVHNEQIAKEMSPKRLRNVASFRAYPVFLGVRL